MIEAKIVILWSLFSLGFFGGFSHCIGMCGPFVLTQISNRMQNTAIDNYGNLQRLYNLALIPYHSGRIVTYSFFGLISGIFGKAMIELNFFKYIAAILLIIAALIFLNYFFKEKILKISFKFHYPRLIKKIIGLLKINQLIVILFKNPKGLKGFFLGIILGFIPCGMLYGAIALSLNLHDPMLSMLGMLIFGLATFPALFASGFGGYFFIKRLNFMLISKAVMLINIILLLLLAVGLIS